MKFIAVVGGNTFPEEKAHGIQTTSADSQRNR